MANGNKSRGLYRVVVVGILDSNLLFQSRSNLGRIYHRLSSCHKLSSCHRLRKSCRILRLSRCCCVQSNQIWVFELQVLRIVAAEASVAMRTQRSHVETSCIASPDIPAVSSHPAVLSVISLTTEAASLGTSPSRASL